ncbi:TonB-dependent receptor [Dysgonomonas sp. 25]|uniref:SusC/RagA family TonB-linked outer membrane protein n=1 Tax=Dysgonomonas sp. 25 TaxID=2302933 RepID=UPI0013D033CD|nr:TonB-dependent receptor [Dysgonomonas sp. 25]NDV70255.1 TonB-dependent receptor [Dysgonomonas sp. 25]
MKHYVLKKQLFLSLCMLFAFMVSIPIYAQDNMQVEGTVIDAVSGETLIGVTVAQKGTSNGTSTDLDGKYSISVPQGTTLTFSYVGFETQEVRVNSNRIDIRMKEADKQLDEVVVIGYGTQRRADVTTAVSSVDTKDIYERPVTSAAAAIQGKAAGVSVIQPSGVPGAEMVVRIRGNTSISASNDPLYVVDGVPTTDIGSLAPTDIETMQILKDASSAAIYGSRAANGVVIITTKGGATGEAKISFTSYLGISKVAKRMNSLNTAEYKELMDEIGMIKVPDGLTDRTDWFDETFRTGTNQNYQLSISSSTDKMKYHVSGGYTRDAGVIKVSYFKRYNFRANLENQVKKWLTVNANLSYSDYSSNGIISGQGANRAGVVLSVIGTPKYAPIWDETPGHEGWYYNNFYGANLTHPVANMSRTADNKSKNNRFMGSGSALFTFTPELKFKSSFTIDRVYYNSTTWLDPIKTDYGREQYGQATDTRSLSTILIFDNILTYDKKIGKHNLSLLGGTSSTRSTWNQSYQTATHFLGSDIKTLNAGNKVSQGNGTTASDWAIMSYLGRVSYNYDSKYLFTANFRADGSSKLAPGKRWGYFPSLSAGWRISAEEFMSGTSTWLDDLKLRGGWGQTGNQAGISDYGYLQKYSITRQNWWEDGKANAMITLKPSSFSNPDLTWETTTQTNIGLDLTVLNGRLTFAADAYYKKTTDLLMDVPLPATSSIGNIYRNEGKMENKGFEFSVDSKNLTGLFSWDTQFNISFNRNKVTKLSLQKVYYYASTSEGTNEKVVRMAEGQPLGKFWGFISEGVDPETGDIIYRDLDGNGKITSSDKTYIGDPNPDFTFGLTNNFSYKNFNLGIFITGSYGNDIYNASRIETEGMYHTRNQSTKVRDRWKIPGQITNMPRATSGTDNIKASTRWVEDGSYVRLKTVTLSYNIQNNKLKKLGIGRIQPYITAQNLYTITDYSGFDPEVNQWGGDARVQGIDWGTYPQVKTFIFGLNVEF